MSYKCIIINAFFNHIKTKNTSDIAFTYLMCDYRFIFTSHIIQHTGELTYKCTECDYCCNCNRHTGENFLSCTMCFYRCKHFRLIGFVNRFCPTKTLIYFRLFNLVKLNDSVFDCYYQLMVCVVLLFTKIYMLFSYVR